MVVEEYEMEGPETMGSERRRGVLVYSEESLQERVEREAMVYI